MFDFVSFIPRAIMQGIPLLFGSTGETLTEKSGNLNLGIAGIMYVGGISGVIGAFLYEQGVGGAAGMNGFLAIMIPLLSCLLGSLLMGLLYCFLTVTLRANQNVTGLAMTTFGVGFGNFMGGSLIKLTGSEVPSIGHEQLLFQIAAVCVEARLVRADLSVLRFSCLPRRGHRARRGLCAQAHARGSAPALRRRKSADGRR